MSHDDVELWPIPYMLGEDFAFLYNNFSYA